MSMRNDEGGVTGMLEWLEWLACLHEWRGWRANVGSMLLLLLLLLLKSHPEGKNVECLLLKQWENVPNRSKKWFKRRTLFEEQVLLYITWTSNARILNMSESQCGQICSVCVTLWICLNILNINMLNKQGF